MILQLKKIPKFLAWTLTLNPIFGLHKVPAINHMSTNFWDGDKELYLNDAVSSPSPPGPAQHPLMCKGDDAAMPPSPDGEDERNGRLDRWPPRQGRSRHQEMAGGSPPAPPPRCPKRKTTPAAMLDGRARGTRSSAAPLASTTTASDAERAATSRSAWLLRPPRAPPGCSSARSLPLTHRQRSGESGVVEWDRVFLG
jgi:hypothetical protein